MTDIWFTSDTHFGHADILTFPGYDGQLIRPGFMDINHMDEQLICNWNAVVKPTDKVYHAGDFGYSISKYRPRLNGTINLIVGNHDKLRQKDFAHFKSIYSWRYFSAKEVAKPFVLSHYPLHLMAFDYKGGASCKHNVHGHIHEKVVLKGNMPDPQYINICVERTNYTPVHIDTLQNKMKS